MPSKIDPLTLPWAICQVCQKQRQCRWIARGYIREEIQVCFICQDRIAILRDYYHAATPDPDQMILL